MALIAGASALDTRYDSTNNLRNALCRMARLGAAQSFVGFRLVESPGLYAAKASDVKRYFKAVETSMH